MPWNWDIHRHVVKDAIKLRQIINMSLKCHKIEINHKHAMKLRYITYMPLNMPRISGISATDSVVEPHINVPSSDLCGGTVELEAPPLCFREVPCSNLAPQTGCSHRFLCSSFIPGKLWKLSEICPRPLPCTPFTASLSRKVWVRILLDLPSILNASQIFLPIQERAFFFRLDR